MVYGMAWHHSPFSLFFFFSFLRAQCGWIFQNVEKDISEVPIWAKVISEPSGVAVQDRQTKE